MDGRRQPRTLKHSTEGREKEQKRRQQGVMQRGLARTKVGKRMWRVRGKITAKTPTWGEEPKGDGKSKEEGTRVQQNVTSQHSTNT